MLLPEIPIRSRWATIAALLGCFLVAAQANGQAEPQLPPDPNQAFHILNDRNAAGANVTSSESPASDETVASASYEQVFSDSSLTDYSIASKPLFDSDSVLSTEEKKPWYERFSLGGYTQVRFGRLVHQDPLGIPPTIFGDSSIGANTGTFSIRRLRLLLQADVSDHMFLYFQSDFANRPSSSSNNTYFAQLRDLYADIYLDTDKVNRFRVGQSKIPWGFQELQSSGKRIPIDRSNDLDSGDSPNQRDLGAFYYWTPVDKQELLSELSSGGLRGTGNYGIFGMGVYNGQGSSRTDLNRSLHALARLTWPFLLSNGQAVEVSLQAYSGQYVVAGAPIRPLGQGAAAVPVGIGPDGLLDQRAAATFVWYPQPFGFQTEWNVGKGPGLNDAQTAVEVRPIYGGYAMVMYMLETPDYGTFIPYARYQHFKGGYKSAANAPFGTHDEYDIGVEWQVRKELELVFEYGFLNGMSLTAIDRPGAISYRNFDGQLLRCQMQINY